MSSSWSSQPAYHLNLLNGKCLAAPRFTRAVEGILRISDYHRREQLQALRMAQKACNERSQGYEPPSVPEECEGDLIENDQTPYKAADGQPTRHDCPADAFSDLPQVDARWYRLSLEMGMLWHGVRMHLVSLLSSCKSVCSCREALRHDDALSVERSNTWKISNAFPL